MRMKRLMGQRRKEAQELLGFDSDGKHQRKKENSELDFLVFHIYKYIHHTMT